MSSELSKTKESLNNFKDLIIKIIDHKTKEEKSIGKCRTLDRIFFVCKNCSNSYSKIFLKNFEFLCSRCILKINSIEKYGVDHPAKSEIVKENSKKTCLTKYGVEYTFQSNNNKNKTKKTLIKKYGVDNPMKFSKIKEKAKQTCIDRYGVDVPAKSPIILGKIYDTKKKNNTFHTSKPEDKLYGILLSRYSNVIRQYCDERYPFSCDFYIPEKDLFIEFQGSWVHGKEAFNKNNKNHIKKINRWAKLSENKKYYKKAIDVWTDLDVRKRELAKLNNLNYLELFDLSGVDNSDSK